MTKGFNFPKFEKDRTRQVNYDRTFEQLFSGIKPCFD